MTIQKTLGFFGLFLVVGGFVDLYACDRVPCITEPLLRDTEAKKLIAIECRKVKHIDPKEEKPLPEKNETFLTPQRLECMEKYCESEETKEDKLRIAKCKKWNIFLARLKDLKEKQSEDELSETQINSDTPVEDAKTIKDPKSAARKSDTQHAESETKAPKKSSQKID